MEKNKTTGPEVIYKEKDVLGLDKPKTGFTKPTKPNNLYIGIALVLLIVYIVYWLMRRLH